MMRRFIFGLLAAMGLAVSASSPAFAQAREPILVPEVSEHEIVLRQGFTGTILLLYGAVLDPRGQRPEEPYDIVVVLKGPTEPIRLREKEQIAGVWVNARSSAYRSVPSFYSIASSRPMDELVEDETAAIYELGLDYLQLSPTGAIDTDEQARFSSGLVDLRMRQGLYAQFDGAVNVNQSVLYHARLPIPSNVRPGRYTAETFAISNKEVIATATAEVRVFKEGFERQVADRSEDSAFFYGLFAIALSLFMGWGAGRLFAYV